MTRAKLLRGHDEQGWSTQQPQRRPLQQERNAAKKCCRQRRRVSSTWTTSTCPALWCELRRHVLVLRCLPVPRPLLGSPRANDCLTARLTHGHPGLLFLRRSVKSCAGGRTREFASEGAEMHAHDISDGKTIFIFFLSFLMCVCAGIPCAYRGLMAGDRESPRFPRSSTCSFSLPLST